MRVPCVTAVICGLLFCVSGFQQVRAERATPEDMERVCENWLSYIVYQKGDWAGSTDPWIEDVHEIAVGDTLLARWFSIAPAGHVVVPVLMEMSPIKAYSDRDACEEHGYPPPRGYPLLLRDILHDRIHLFLEAYGSLDVAQPATGGMVFGPQGREEWDRLLVDSDRFAADLRGGAFPLLAEVGPLLSTAWRQGDPYNLLCPDGDGGKCVVGCVATAAAQVMKYHQWPPTNRPGRGYSNYIWNGDDSCEGNTQGQHLWAYHDDPLDWANMPDDCVSGCTTAQNDALSELCYEVGVAFEMDYGHCRSAAWPGHALTVFPEHFRYDSAINYAPRDDFSTAGAWFDVLKYEINQDRPMMYYYASDSSTAHEIVCDGWRDTGGTNQYHMNYGWGGSCTGWYTIDHLYGTGSSALDESVIRRIQPAYEVCHDGSGDFPTIQAAIDACGSEGEIILVGSPFDVAVHGDALGINFRGKAIRIRSASGNPENCIIDCTNGTRGFVFSSGEGPSSRLEGVKIINGSHNFGGGIACGSSSPTIVNCILSNNQANFNGGGISCDVSSSPTIQNCIFRGNTAANGGGGGLYCVSNSSPTVTSCVFSSNSADVGGGMGCFDYSNAQLTYCTFYANSASNVGGGICCGSSSQVTVDNTIIAFGTQGGAVECDAGCIPDFDCSDIYRNVGGDWTGLIANQLGQDNNISRDPLFCNAASGDFTVCGDSPCLPGGTCVNRIGAGEEGCGHCAGACCIGSTCSITSQGVCEDAGGAWDSGTISCNPNPCNYGACCVGTVCSMGSEAECAAASGNWLGEQVSCPPNPCNSGACCVGSTCHTVSEAECEQLTGQWVGENIPCAPNPCDIGACCYGSTCQTVSEAECEDGGDEWFGAGTTCDPNPCNEGACCIGTVCNMVSEAECVESSGSWLGEQESCDLNPCNSGACCVGSVCQTESEAGCASISGEWLGADVPCTPNPCNEGACCIGSSCQTVSAAECATAGGDWLGPSVSCDVAPCIPGACCDFVSNCQILTWTECATTHGTWMGGGESCDPNPCPGACCFDDQPCQYIFEDDCNAAGGGFHGGGCGLCGGACCVFPMGDCYFVQEWYCIDEMGGFFFGEGVPCEPNPCQGPAACCFSQWDCAIMDADECEEMGGYWLGDGMPCEACEMYFFGACCFETECRVLPDIACSELGGIFTGFEWCDPNPCVPGACCIGATCEFTTLLECWASYGEWMDEVTSCEPNPCVGPCCFPDGTCEIMLENDCSQADGEWEGDENDSCDPNPCEPETHWTDHDVGNCVLTVTDQGIIGFMDDTQTEGSGFIYPADGGNNLYLGSLWVGESEAYVANRDYTPEPIKEWIVSVDPPGYVFEDSTGWMHGDADSDQDIYASYTDDGATEPRGLFVDQESWAFAAPDPADDLVIINYRIRNNGGSDLANVYVGCFLDVDIGEAYNDDTGGTDHERALTYMTDASGIHVGVSLLRDDAAQEPPLGTLTLISNGMCDPYYIYDETKYRLLSAAGPDYVLPDAPTPADYRILASAGPILLGAGEDILVAFAVTGGEDLESLLANADAALLIYQQGITDTPPPDPVAGGTRLLPSMPNPFRQVTVIRFELIQTGSVHLGIYDVAGRLVRTLAAGQLPPNRYTLTWDGRDDGGREAAGGVYFLRLDTGQTRDNRPLIRLK